MFDEIPNGWFVWALRDERTLIKYCGEKHKRIRWVCELQHEDGGKLTTGAGSSPAAAVKNAIDAARFRWPKAI